MYCIDEGQEIKIGGRDEFDFMRLEVLILPCTPSNTTCQNNTL